MATEPATARVELDGQQAENQLKELQAEATKLRKELKQLRMDKDPNYAQKLREFNELDKKIKDARKSTFDLTQVINNLSGASMKELTRAQRTLNSELRNMNRATDEGKRAFAEKSRQLQKVQVEIARVNTQMKGYNSGMSLFGRMAQGFNKYLGIITAGTATFAGAIIAGRKAIKAYAEFDDKVADVMKTTGMAKEEVYAMNQAFKEMNTRTAQNELLELAVVAGKLGFSARSDVEGFVKAADIIGVALKEDFGGNVEETLKQIGKLVDVFRLKEKFGIEESMLKVASTLNELGMASTASEGNIVEFTRRMAGIAPLAGISIENIMGLGAAVDSLGLTSETSSTALSKFLIDMTKNVSVFAKYAKMDVKSFTDILNNDANEAFVRVLEGVRGNSNALTELAGSLGDVGADGGRMIGVLGTLANNTDKLRTQQDLANKSMLEGTSVINEFNIKNNTAQATLEKARKNLQNISVELGQKLMPLMSMGTNIANYFLKGLNAILPASRNFAVELSEQTDKVINLETKIRPLADRYDELKSKTELSKTEQSELNDIIKTISGTIPGAVTQFDNYGNAIAISTTRVREFIQVETDRLKVVNKAAIEQMGQELGRTQFLLDESQSRMEQIEKEGTFTVNELINWGGRTTTIRRQATADEIADAVSRNQQLISQRNGYQAEIDRLSGDALQKEMERREAERKSALELEEKKLLYKTKSKAELERLATEGDTLAIEMLRETIIIPSEVANAYEALTKKISEAQKALQGFVAAGDFESSEAIGLTIKELEASKKVLDGIIAAGGDVGKFLDNLTDSSQAELDETLGINKQFAEDFKDIFADIDETKKQQHQDELDRIKNRIEFELSEEDRKDKEKKDKFEQWRDFSIEATQQISNAAFSIAKQNIDDQANAQLSALQKQKDTELSNKNLTEAQRAKIEEKYRKQEAKIKAEAYRKQKAADILQAIINTALAVTKALASVPPPANFVAAALAGTAGAAQIAVIAAQKVPQFSKGRYNVIGADDGRNYNVPYLGAARTGIYERPALISERGPELIVDAPTTKHLRINYPGIIDAIQSARVPQYASGKYPEPIPSPMPSKQETVEFMLAVNVFKSIINDLKTNGIPATLNYQDFRKFENKVDDIESKFNI